MLLVLLNCMIDVRFQGVAPRLAGVGRRQRDHLLVVQYIL